MSDEAKVLAATEAGWYATSRDGVVFNAEGPRVVDDHGTIRRRVLLLEKSNPKDALAAAAEALGLESRYVVLPRGRCTRCGRYASDERRLTIFFDEETDAMEGVFCADGCGNSEEEKR